MYNLKKLYNYLKKQKNKKILFLTTSNRWEGDNELPKSSIIADELIKKLGSDRVQLINVAKLKPDYLPFSPAWHSNVSLDTIETNLDTFLEVKALV